MEFQANRRVETSARTFAILEYLGRVGQARISTISDELEMSKGIVHNHVSTLRELGYVTKSNEFYQLSPKLLSIGLRVRSESPLYRFASEILEEFADKTEAGVVLFQRSDTEGVVIDAYQLPPTSDLAVGASLSLSNSLLGLVVLIELDNVSINEDSKYEINQIINDLEEDGYAVGPLSETIVSQCVAFPVTSEDGQCSGSVGVVLPEHYPEQDIQQILETIPSLREQIEGRFQYDWSERRSVITAKHSWIGN
jgi:DNA-binding IclR family transcriptional regulator